ncbi:MAG: hypothetical protein ACKOHN_08290, partial [Actinomycetota bacterium]
RTSNMGAGIGFMGEVGRLEVTYAGGSGPATVIAKIPTQDTTVRGLLGPPPCCWCAPRSRWFGRRSCRRRAVRPSATRRRWSTWTWASWSLVLPW